MNEWFKLLVLSNPVKVFQRIADGGRGIIYLTTGT
jgi:hypothetical protein